MVELLDYPGSDQAIVSRYTPTNPERPRGRPSRTSWLPRTRWLTALAVALALCCGGPIGCTRQAPHVYKARDEIQELPEKQRTEIAQALTHYFGTPARPRYLMPAAVTAASTAAADSTADSADSAESSVGSDGSGQSTDPAGSTEPTAFLTALAKLPAQDRFAAQYQGDSFYLRRGAESYIRLCAPCHGITGDGKGEAAEYLDPPPRDYRLGKFKFTSTPRSYKPRRVDLQRIVRYGAKGTSMPAFRWLPADEVEAILDYVVVLSSRGELELAMIRDARDELEETDSFPPSMVASNVTRIDQSWREADSMKVVPLSPPTVASEESIRAGAKAFVQLNCYKCHGKDGKGNKAFDVGKDDWGRIAYAADLTSGTLHGGRRPIDIYRRIYSGINATPMPAFSQPDSSQGETVEQRSATIWNLVHFVTSVVEGRPLPMDVIEHAIPPEAAPATGASEAPSAEASSAEASSAEASSASSAPPASSEEQ